MLTLPAGRLRPARGDLLDDLRSAAKFLPGRRHRTTLDAEASRRALFGFGDGWNEQEHEAVATGRLWRWMSERGTLRVREGTLWDPLDLARRARGVVRLRASRSAWAIAVSRSRDCRTLVLGPRDALRGRWSREAEKRDHHRDQRVVRAGGAKRSARTIAAILV